MDEEDVSLSIETMTSLNLFPEYIIYHTALSKIVPLLFKRSNAKQMYNTSNKVDSMNISK